MPFILGVTSSESALLAELHSVYVSYSQRIGQIAVSAIGLEACRDAYDTDIIEEIGQAALAYGDIRADGSIASLTDDRDECKRS